MCHWQKESFPWVDEMILLLQRQPLPNWREWSSLRINSWTNCQANARHWHWNWKMPAIAISKTIKPTVNACLPLAPHTVKLFIASNNLCLVGPDGANQTKRESGSQSVRPIKRKEPIKVDISVKVVPKPHKVSYWKKPLVSHQKTLFRFFRRHMHSLRTDRDELMDRLSSIWRLLKMLLHESRDSEKVVFSNCLFSL